MRKKRPNCCVHAVCTSSAHLYAIQGLPHSTNESLSFNRYPKLLPFLPWLVPPREHTRRLCYVPWAHLQPHRHPLHLPEVELPSWTPSFRIIHLDTHASSVQCLMHACSLRQHRLPVFGLGYHRHNHHLWTHKYPYYRQDALISACTKEHHSHQLPTSDKAAAI